MLTKEFQKTFMKQLKIEGKKKNFKYKNGCLYKKMQDCFVYADCRFLPKGTEYNFEIWLRIKKYVYDNIFWETIGVGDNAKCAESLRAEGAFVCPAITIKIIQYFLENENLNIIKEIVEEIEQNYNEFLENNSITEYIKNMHSSKMLNGDTLKTIAYIECGMLNEAKEIIEDAVKKGESGGFIIGDKSFFEYAKDYLERK